MTGKLVGDGMRKICGCLKESPFLMAAVLDELAEVFCWDLCHKLASGRCLRLLGCRLWKSHGRRLFVMANMIEIFLVLPYCPCNECGPLICFAFNP